MGPKSYRESGGVHFQGCWGGRAESRSDARGGRVPHLLGVGEATAAARTEASARRLPVPPYPPFKPL